MPATSGTEEDLMRGRERNEKTDTCNLASGESGGPPAGHGMQTKWLLSACTFIGRSHMRSFSSVQSLSRVRLFPTPWIAACQASLPITNSQSLLKLMPIESVMPSSHFILYCPLLLLPPVPTSIRVFSNESNLCMRWPKYWSFSFSISPSNEHPGLVSFRMDWLDLLTVQGTLKSLLQHHSSKASILGAQLSSQPNSHIHTWPLEKP